MDCIVIPNPTIRYDNVQFDKESPQIRMTFIQIVIKKEYEFQSLHRSEIGRWSTKRLIVSIVQDFLCVLI